MPVEQVGVCVLPPPPEPLHITTSHVLRSPGGGVRTLSSPVFLSRPNVRPGRRAPAGGRTDAAVHCRVHLTPSHNVSQHVWERGAVSRSVHIHSTWHGVSRMDKGRDTKGS